MIRTTKLQYITTACLLAILCYGLLFFHDNALGGLVKPTITVMAKSQKDGGQPPKKNGVKATTPKPNVATQDSTRHYADQVRHAQVRSDFHISKKVREEEKIKLQKAKDDLARQRNKGKPGYDKNGYPIKK
jgi:hypothetical protein